MKIVLKKEDCMDDWYVIERAEHDGSTWFEQTGPNSYSFRNAANISDACIEGTKDEMVAIARGIQVGEDVAFKRCAILCRSSGIYFFSPKNSTEYGVINGFIPIEEAYELSEQILRELAPKPMTQP